MNTLDHFYFNPSSLTIAKQTEISEQVETMVSGLNDSGFKYKLYFRNMHGIPNAMALPGGEIIVTDALADLANPKELEAVLWHETGHVEERHGMQHAIKASVISMTVMMSLGDLSGVAETAISVPIFLTQASYSRTSEAQADAYAFRQLELNGTDPKHFATMIKKLAGDSDEHERSYFSSHPNSNERADAAMKASVRFSTQR